MGNCKIVYNDTVLIDLSQDSVTPETLDEGVTAHDKDGNPIVGVRPVGGVSSENLDAEISEQAEKIEELLTVLDSKAAGSSVEMCTVTLTSTFAGVNTLVQGYADVFVLEEDFSTAAEGRNLFKHVGEFVEKSISVSVPKGSTIYASVSFDYLEWYYNVEAFQEAYVYIDNTKYVSINGAVLLQSLSDMVDDGGFAGGELIWGFAVYGDCEITFAPINTETWPEDGEE